MGHHDAGVRFTNRARLNGQYPGACRIAYLDVHRYGQMEEIELRYGVSGPEAGSHLRQANTEAMREALSPLVHIGIALLTQRPDSAMAFRIVQRIQTAGGSL